VLSKVSEAKSGCLFIDKPVGPTSHDVVAQVRRALNGAKVGHAGTLDPLASGLLILGVGSATKLLSKLMGLDKTYEFTVTLGATTDTDDAETAPVFKKNVVVPTNIAVQSAVAKFIGEQQQIPPSYSAKKQSGVRLYKLARRGQPVTAKAHQIFIRDLTIAKYDYPLLKLELRCSSGTYVRSLARDIGEVLGTGGYVSALRRTAIGQFGVSEGLQLVRDNDYSSALLLPENVLERIG
jgi:tRNA pseudouridine55 synthase